jgi:pimeloyl-ACP methyl ester carboxylesterase
MTVVLIHGAATDSRVWRHTIPILEALGETVIAPDRPQSGDLDTEIEFLTPLCVGATVIGVSGGATLGLELAARGVPLHAAVLHEPAAGSLAPGLLAHVAHGLASHGIAGFGSELYGPSWNPADTTVSEDTVRREFTMFGSFEPRELRIDPRRVTLLVGEHSPSVRFESVLALANYLGVEWGLLPGVGHAAHLDGGFTREGVANLLSSREGGSPDLGVADGPEKSLPS